MDSYVNLTVAVPTDRLADFHLTLGRWLDEQDPDDAEGLRGEPSAAPDELMTDWGSDPSDAEAAKLLWKKLSPTAQAIMEVLMAEPGKEYSGDQLAERLGVKNGKYGIAGALAWPGRYSYAMLRKHPVHYREADDGQARYRLEAAAAELFQAAAEAAS